MAFKFNPITGTLDLVGGGGGPATNGLPVGGVQYDLLVKNSATDYDAIWSRTLDTLTVNGTLTAPDVHGSMRGPIYEYAKNTSGSIIPAGHPVYITGSVGASGPVEVAAANASNSATMPAIGLARTSIAINAFGDIILLGALEDLNTSAYSINQVLYVAPSGGLTATRPSTNAQPIARVARVQTNTGQVNVLGPGVVYATVAFTGAYSDLSGTPSSLPPSGPAGGDLSGTYPNPTLSTTKQNFLLDRANHTGTQSTTTIVYDANVTPSTDGTYDFGNVFLRWKDIIARNNIYVGIGSGTSGLIYLNANQTNPTVLLSHSTVANECRVVTQDSVTNATNKLNIKTGNTSLAGAASGNLEIGTGTVTTGTRGNVLVNAPAITPSSYGGTTIGSTSLPWNTAYIAGSCYVGYAQTGQIYIIANTTNPNIYLWQSNGSNYCLINTLDRSTGPTNKLLIRSGNTTTSGNSGDIEIATGTAAGGGTRGKVLLNGNYIDANSTKIQNLANGTAATDAIAYGQVSTAGRTGSYTDLTSTPASSTGTFTTGIKTAEFALTDAATITTTNCSSYNTFTVTIAGNRTLGSFTTGTNGQKIAIRVRQDGTGGRTLSFDSTYWNLGADVSFLSIASGANVYSYVGAIYNSTSSKWDVVSIVRGY